MPEITSCFEGKVTNVFAPIGCVAFEVREGALLVGDTELVFEKGAYYVRTQNADSVQINRRPVQVVTAGERCAILMTGFEDELPPNNAYVYRYKGALAQVGGKGTIFKVYDKGVIALELTEGALCQGDWIVIQGEDGYRHDQIVTSIEIGRSPQPAALVGTKCGVLLDPGTSLPAEGATVTVVSVKRGEDRERAIIEAAAEACRREIASIETDHRVGRKFGVYR